MKTRIFILLLGSVLFCATRVFAEPHEIKKSETVILDDHANLVAGGFNEPVMFTAFEHENLDVVPVGMTYANVVTEKHKSFSVPPDKLGQFRRIFNFYLASPANLITHYFHCWPPSRIRVIASNGGLYSPPLS